MELNLNGREQERFSAILTSTISSLCKNGMINSTVARVDGILGITLANNIVFLVKVQEQVCETEICRQPSVEKICSAEASNNASWTRESQADSAICQLVISNVQQGVSMAPDEQVENAFDTEHEVGVISGFQAVDIGSLRSPNRDSHCVQISAGLNKKKNYNKPSKKEEQELLNKSTLMMLEAREENRTSRGSKEVNDIVYEPHYLDGMANILYDNARSSVGAHVKMECFSEDDLTRDCCQSQEADVSQVNQSEHLRSKAFCSNSVLSDHTTITPQIVKTAPRVVKTAPRIGKTAPRVVKTAPRVVKTAPRVVMTALPVVWTARQAKTTPEVVTATPEVVRTTPQVADCPKVRRRRTHAPSLADVSSSKDLTAVPPSLKRHTAAKRGKMYRRYSKETFTIAINEVVNKTLTTGQASRMFGIPPTSLHDAVKRLERKTQSLKLK